MPPWVIEELEQERLRRDEEDRRQSQRIELPQTSGETLEDAPVKRPEAVRPDRRVEIFDISPGGDSTFSI
jgi:hypothetical protein